MSDIDDGLEERFGDGPRQDDLEARHWRGAVAARLFGRDTAPVSIGRFRVLERVGSGGAGVVYSAWDPKLERRVAVKVLRGDHDPREVEREAKLLAKLNHPNVVAVYDVGECEERSFLAMEFVDGTTLQEHIEQHGTWTQRLSVLVQAAAGLKAAHEVGVVHGDIKPSNLLVGSDGRLRVTDFGTAHAGEDRLLGATPAYMAPEQARGEAATVASDQFSLCATAFEVFHGTRPFPGESAEDVRTALAAGRRVEPSGPSALPRWLKESLDRGLSQEPADRFPSLGELLAVWQRGLRPARGWVAAGVLGLLGAVATAAAMQQPEADACAQTRTRLQALWNAPRRASLATRFQAHGQPFAEKTWARVQSEVDTHVDELHGVLADACALTNEEMSLRRRLCVERRLIELSAFLEVLDAADASVVEESVQALTLLTDPRGCVLDARPMGAPNEEERRLVLEAVARARALRGVGKVDEALQTLQAARSDAHEIRDPALTARILLELGDSLAMQQGVSESSPTLATLEAALLAADAADAPHLTARALLSLANANHRATRFDDALRWLDRLDAHLEGLEAPRIRGRAAILRALVGAMQNPEGDAAPTRAALDRLREAGSRDTWLALGLNNLGELEFERLDDASAGLHYQQALEIFSDVLGPAHPTTAGTHGNLGEIALLAGDFDAALQHFTTALEIRTVAWGADSLWVMHTRAHVADVHRAAGRLAEAESLYQGVLAFARKEVPLVPADSFFELDVGSGQLGPWALHGLALIALEHGDPQAALEWSSQVDPRTHVRPERHPDHAARFDVHALALIELGRYDEARIVLDRFEPSWKEAYVEGGFKRVYGLLARAELEFATGATTEACAATASAEAIPDSAVPAPAQARLERLRTRCAASQVD